jgi:hypothetical protein
VIAGIEPPRVTRRRPLPSALVTKIARRFRGFAVEFSRWKAIRDPSGD